MVAGHVGVRRDAGRCPRGGRSRTGPCRARPRAGPSGSVITSSAGFVGHYTRQFSLPVDDDRQGSAVGCSGSDGDQKSLAVWRDVVGRSLADPRADVEERLRRADADVDWPDRHGRPPSSCCRGKEEDLLCRRAATAAGCRPSSKSALSGPGPETMRRRPRIGPTRSTVRDPAAVRREPARKLAVASLQQRASFCRRERARTHRSPWLPTCVTLPVLKRRYCCRATSSGETCRSCPTSNRSSAPAPLDAFCRDPGAPCAAS